uniref:Ig-like domain-containing protein n=1 Tax=Fundulus heteroclitus TaxID=8078 RepID=A0A3Q2Q573_FUNHE
METALGCLENISGPWTAKPLRPITCSIKKKSLERRSNIRCKRWITSCIALCDKNNFLLFVAFFYKVEAVNGTSVKLTCTFTSTHPVSPQTVIVSWNFQPVNSKNTHRVSSTFCVFYYQEDPHPPPEGIFKGHVEWSGDIMRKDASITLLDVQPIFNGTYSCRVTNNPDVHGEIGKTDLRVVNKSELSILGAIVGGSCAFVLILLGIYVAWKMYRKRQRERDIEMHPNEQFEKDPTVW